MPFETGRRLCLLFEAGSVRYAVEATSVVEVSPPDAEGDKLRGVFDLTDLSVVLGGGGEERPGLALLVDVSPTRAVRIRKVVEVADVAQAPFFMLPPGLGERLGRLVRGAFLYQAQLFLELAVEALAEPRAPLEVSPGASPVLPVFPLEAAPERGLIFESQGRLYGLPLPWVLQVVAAAGPFSPLPSEGGPVAGLYAHDQALWPIYSAPGLLGGEARREPLFILADLAGHHVGLCATRVLGVHGSLQRPEGAPGQGGEFLARGIPGPSLFLDFQRMFS